MEKKRTKKENTMKKQIMIIILAVAALWFWAGSAAADNSDMVEMNRLQEEGKKAFYAAKYPEAIAKWQKGLELAKKAGNKKYVSRFVGNIGVVFQNLGQYDRALSYYEQALAIDREIGDRRGEGSDLTNMGVVYRNLGLYDKAMKCYEQALVIGREIGDKRGEGVNLSNIGVVFQNLGQYDKALRYCEQALAIEREIGDRRGEGIDLMNIATTYLQLGRYDEALTYYGQALAIKREIGGSEGNILGNIGLVYENLGEYEKSLSYHMRALVVHKESNDRKGEGDDRGNIGVVYDCLGEYDKSLSYHAQALAIHKEIGDIRGGGIDLMNIGLVYGGLGQFNRSLNYYEKALAITKEIGDRRGEGNVFNCIGLAYGHLGQPYRALNYYEQALAIKKEIGDLRGEGNNLTNMGVEFDNLGQNDNALTYYRQGLTISKKIGDRKGEGVNLINMGVAYNHLGKYEKATIVFDGSIKICSEIGATDILWRAQRGLAEAEGKLEKHDAAVLHYEQSLDNIEKIREGISKKENRNAFMWDKIFIYDEFITLLRKLHQKHPGKGYDKKSFEIFERKQGRIFLEQMGESGARNFGDFPKELRDKESELQTALAKKQSRLADERSKSSNDRDTKGIRKLETEINGIRTEQEKFKAEIAKNHPDYFALRYPKPATLKELQNKVLKPGELMLIYNVMEESTCLWLLGKDHFAFFPLDISQKKLDAEIGVFREEAGKIVKLVDRVANTENPIAKNREMKLLRRETKKALPEVRQKGAELYELLIPEKARPLISGAKLLYVVPTGALYGVPFGALVRNTPLRPQGGNLEDENVGNPPLKGGRGDVDSVMRNTPLRPQGGNLEDENVGNPPLKGGRGDVSYLIEDHAVAYLSSASLLKILREARERRRETPAHSLLAFAHPRYGSGKNPCHTFTKGGDAADTSFAEMRLRGYIDLMGGNLCELPETENEVREIGKCLNASKTLLQLREKASESNVFAFSRDSKLDDYRYVVFSCHGLLGDPEEKNRLNQPALALSIPDPSDKNRDGFLTMAEIFGLKLNAELVVLSACNSGRGQIQRGEGVRGLTRAFMYAGTPAVSVTLWSVADKSSTVLSTGFFKNRERKQGKMSQAEALRKIKLDMIRGKHDELYQHPFFWAPVVIFGDAN